MVSRRESSEAVNNAFNRQFPEDKGASIPYHAQSVSQVLDVLNTSEEGLANGTASKIRENSGFNELPKPKGDSKLKMVWRQINTPLIWVLIASGILAIIMGKKVDGAVVLGVVFLNTLIGFIQEYKAGKAIEALMNMVSEQAVVIRDGRRVTLPSRELVPGDVVLLQSGDKVPADVRLIHVKNLKVDESALTGESLPVSKFVDVVAKDVVLGDRKNMAYNGTLVTYGTATAVVVEIGLRTELGKISSMLSTTTHIETPLTKNMESVAKWLTLGIVIVSFAIFGISLAKGYPLIDAMLAAITLAVAAIPEGLPAIITIALAIGVRRMAIRRAIIRKLPAVETLGSTTVICSDKTGTLTKNEMTVQIVWTPKAIFSLTGVGYSHEGEFLLNGKNVDKVPKDAYLMLTAGVLCNDATVTHDKNAKRHFITGDPTEAALVVSAQKAKINPDTLRKDFKRLDEIPFESEQQWMATLHKNGESTKAGKIVFLKGAPEVILKKCSTYSDGKKLDAKVVLQEVDRHAQNGMRVLAFAYKDFDSKKNKVNESDLTKDCIFLGLQAMIDPPRPEAIDAIARSHTAGISVKMITGDHRGTAEAIGRELGLLRQNEHALTGEELAAIDDNRLVHVARDVNVFARVAPEQKLRLVRALQKQGQVVAMSGDGVNDAPALRQANIGVAMGITGTAVSKEASDVVLVDDNFASITAAVEEGRRVFDNLIKSLAFVLPTNLGEALIIMLAVLLFPVINGQVLMPIEPVQILWINLVATVTLALPLAFEAMEPDIMKRAPRNPKAPLLDSFVIRRTILVAILMAIGAILLFNFAYGYELSHGVDATLALARAQTMAVTTVILMQVFYLLNCRSLEDSIRRIGLFTNNFVYAGIFTIIVLQAGYMYFPFMTALFHSAPLSATQWGISALVAFSVLPVIAIDKWFTHGRASSSK